MDSAFISRLLLFALALWVAGCGVLTEETDPSPEIRGEPITISASSAPTSYDRPEWNEEAVVYEISVRDFTEEGTFRAIIPHLPRLKEMGVTVLWLMPIHPIGKERRLGEWGSPYSVRDYFEVHSAYGTKEDFRALVESVHDQDMRLILDLVANHTAWDHPWIEAHPEWYEQDEDGNITHPEGTEWTDVAALDYDRPGLRSAMKEVMRYWVEEFEVDGYRADAAALVPGDFWENAIEEVRSVAPVLMLAEADAPSLHNRGFDLSYSWPTYLTLKAVWKGAPTSRLASVLAEEQKRFPAHALRLRYTTNHDEVAADGAPTDLFGGRQGAQAAALFTAAVPSIPLLYNGQEVGSAHPPFRGTSIDWDQHPDMEAFYSRLFRKVRPAVRGGDLIVHHPEGEDVLVLERKGGEESLLILINVRTQEVEAPLPTSWEGQRLREVFREQIREADEAVSLQGHGYRVFRKANPQ
jgi:glycosidase